MRARIVVSALLFVSSLWGQTGETLGGATPGQLRTRLVQALEVADRVVIHPSAMSAATEQVLFELKDREAIRELAGLLEFEGESIFHCACLGTHRIEFFAGAHYCFEFTYHHLSRLRGDWEAPWAGDAVLTEAAKERMIAWFARKGFGAFEQMEKDWRRQEEERVRRRADLLAFFPAGAEPLVPVEDFNRSWSMERTGNLEKFSALFSDPAQQAVACWRALGYTFEQRKARFLMLMGEPEAFLLESLAELSPETIQRAYAMLGQTELRARLGCLRHFSQLGKAQKTLAAGWSPQMRLCLVRDQLGRQPVPAMGDLVDILADQGSAEADALLLELAQGHFGREPVRTIEEGAGRGAADLIALVVLGRHEYEPARAEIRERLVRVKTQQERLALEIAQLWSAKGAGFAPRHLGCALYYGRFAQQVWEQLGGVAAQGNNLEMLVAALASPSYEVKGQAEKALAERGLQSIATTKKQTEEAMKTLYQKTLGLVAEGRLGAAQANVQEGRKGPQGGAFMVVSGLVAYLQENYEGAADCFAAAGLLGEGDETLVFRHMSLLHLGRAGQSPLVGWTYAFGSDKKDWPEALLSYLRGELDREAMLAAVASERRWEEPRGRSLALWVLAEQARLAGDAAGEKAMLAACVGSGQALSPALVLARRRSALLEMAGGRRE